MPDCPPWQHIRVIAIPAPILAPDQLYKPFTDENWLYEIKFDGYRCMAGVEAGEPTKTRLQMATDAELRVRLLTKAGRDCSAWFAEIGEALAMLPGGPHVIDGEACCSSRICRRCKRFCRDGRR